jgi:TolA-binding protein
MKKVSTYDAEPNLAIRAKYWYAEAIYQQEEYIESAAVFSELRGVPSFPEAHLLPWISLRAAQSQSHLEKWPLAKSIALESLKQYPKFNLAYEFEFLIARCEFATGNLVTAINLFTKVTEAPQARGTETAAQAQWRIGEAQFLQEKYADAIRSYYRVESLHQHPYWQAAALLQAGKCQEKLRNFKQATILYANLIKKYPDSEFAKPARQRLSALDRQVQENTKTQSLFR